MKRRHVPKMAAVVLALFLDRYYFHRRLCVCLCVCVSVCLCVCESVYRLSQKVLDQF